MARDYMQKVGALGPIGDASTTSPASSIGTGKSVAPFMRIRLCTGTGHGSSITTGRSFDDENGAMMRFKSARQCERPFSTHSQIANLFHLHQRSEAESARLNLLAHDIRLLRMRSR
jgi:hypothetical protein